MRNEDKINSKNNNPKKDYKISKIIETLKKLLPFRKEDKVTENLPPRKAKKE